MEIAITTDPKTYVFYVQIVILSHQLLETSITVMDELVDKYI